MSLKSILARPFAWYMARQIHHWSSRAVNCQEMIRENLVSVALKTQFGQDHGFTNIRSYEEFKTAVPIRDYEELKPYIDAIIEGKENVLWPGKPIYFAKTSGTTSGTKFIPISKDSIKNHMNGARSALLLYIAATGRTDFVNGKMIFLSGSPELEEVNGIKTGRLSGIVNHHIPRYLKRNQLPSYNTNCIEDWETKLDEIVDETIWEDMTLISGIPPWVQMYFEKLLERSGKETIGDLFSRLSVFAYGGVNFEPYRQQIETTIGKPVATIETYPASEGFIAFQDRQGDKGLLLNSNAGIFFEFVPTSEIFSENPTRLSLGEVELGVNYALILNTNAGLFGYNIGDTVKFVELDPYRIVVTGRVKHFISAFGEHVIAEEVEGALIDTANGLSGRIVEFTVAPKVIVDEGLPHHEWFIEFEDVPADLESFALQVDQNLQKRNIYYADLIEGKVLQTLKISPIRKNGFREFMESKGKLGGQNKVPRLADNRDIADELSNFAAPN